MSDTDKIISAIVTAAMCGRAQNGYTEYMRAYDQFLSMMPDRSKRKKSKWRKTAGTSEAYGSPGMIGSVFERLRDRRR